MKHCNSCNSDKDESEFHRRRASKDGLNSKCKACVSAYDRTRANLPHRVEQRKAYQQTEAYKEKHEGIVKSWRQRNREKMRAHSAVARAIRKGTLVRQHCERCGHYKAEAHHDDYSKPLDVNWLCDDCHKARHIELRLEARPWQDQKWNINTMLGFNDEPEPTPEPDYADVPF